MEEMNDKWLNYTTKGNRKIMNGHFLGINGTSDLPRPEILKWCLQTEV